jgi:cysteine-rich repeat protein
MKKIFFLTTLILFCNLITVAQNKFFNVLECKNLNQENYILIFYKPDCPYCLHLRNDIDSSLLFQKVLQEKYSIVSIDVTTIEGQKLVAKYDVKSVPLLMSSSSKNSVIKIIKGYNSLNKIAQFLNLNFATNIDSKNTLGICGNGILESDEACDDGNLINGDGCESNCTITPTISICGNGILESGETCDDGNLINGDGCESNCTITPIISICGNGILESGETCDDGNLVNGDGCESNCAITPTTSICGNGILESGETCDDGNLVNGDGCESNCTLSILSYENYNDFFRNIVLSPMPFTNYFSVVFDSNRQTDFIISIYNGNGQLVKYQSISTINIGKTTINISELENLTSGIYFLKIENKDGNYSEVRKIVKM